MIAGKTLVDLSKEIDAQAKSKRDFLVNTAALTCLDDGRLNLPLDSGKEPLVMEPTGLCRSQIGERLGIPRAYVERMAAEAPKLLAQNFNHWFKAGSERRLLRVLDGPKKVARAFLSDRYRPLDNYDLCNAVLPKIVEAGCRVESAQLTDTHLYLQAVTPRLEGLIERRKTEGVLEKGVHTPLCDVVQAGVTVSNSEVGVGAVLIEPLVFVLKCRNGLIVSSSLRKHHVGRSGWLDEDQELFTDDTRKLDDKAFWAKVCDVMDAALNEIRFRETVKQMQEAAESPWTVTPSTVVEVTSKYFHLNDTESENVLDHLARGGDLSHYGLVQAVTRSAEDCPNYDRAVELERIGGKLLEIAPRTLLALGK